MTDNRQFVKMQYYDGGNACPACDGEYDQPPGFTSPVPRGLGEWVEWLYGDQERDAVKLRDLVAKPNAGLTGHLLVRDKQGNNLVVPVCEATDDEFAAILEVLRSMTARLAASRQPIAALEWAKTAKIGDYFMDNATMSVWFCRKAPKEDVQPEKANRRRY